MRLKLILIGFLVVSAGGYLGAAHLSGGALPTFGLPLGGDRGALRRIALSFLEDIQFKDFSKAASYHAPGDQDEVDIPFLIWKLFAVKPEALDFMDYEIMMADLDDSGDRARVKARMNVKFLANQKVRKQDLMLYFNREGEGSPWHMKFEDSLRRIEAKKDKKK